MLKRWRTPSAASRALAGFKASLPALRASLVRAALQAAMEQQANLDSLLSAAHQAGWSTREVQKLQAYGECYSGQAAQAYQRILAQDLVRDDLELAITILVYAYRAQRYDEAVTLLGRIDEGGFAAHPDLALFYTQAI